MDSLVSLVMFFMLMAIGALVKGAAQKAKARPATPRPQQSEQAKSRAETASSRTQNGFASGFGSDTEGWSSLKTFGEGVDPCHDHPDETMSSEGGWDSAQSYHEGEDPCHDDLSPITSSSADVPVPADNERARELMRGIVISEILTRKTRRIR